MSFEIRLVWLEVGFILREFFLKVKTLALFIFIRGGFTPVMSLLVHVSLVAMILSMKLRFDCFKGGEICSLRSPVSLINFVVDASLSRDLVIMALLGY